MIYLMGYENTLVPFSHQLKVKGHYHDTYHGYTDVRYGSTSTLESTSLVCDDAPVYYSDVGQKSMSYAELVRAEFFNLIRWGAIKEGDVVNLWDIAKTLEERQWKLSTHEEVAQKS